MPGPVQRLADRHSLALVTGASSGIGKAIAEALLREGLVVHGTSRNPDRQDLNPEIHWVPFEGGEPGAGTRFAKAYDNLLSKIDLLVNNAGSGLFGEASAYSSSVLTEHLQLLLETPMELTLAVLPGMRTRRCGAVVNVSSLAAEFPLPYMSAYTAAKAGLSGFTQSLILTETVPGVQLINFQPGDFRTAFNEVMARPPELSLREERAWKIFEKHLKEGPPPERAARDLIKALRRGRSGTVRSGGFFQTRVAPLGIRLLPRACLLRMIRRYHGIAGK
jgi:short-subunit dehydrogenase